MVNVKMQICIIDNKQGDPDNPERFTRGPELKNLISEYFNQLNITMVINHYDSIFLNDCRRNFIEEFEDSFNFQQECNCFDRHVNCLNYYNDAILYFMHYSENQEYGESFAKWLCSKKIPVICYSGGRILEKQDQPSFQYIFRGMNVENLKYEEFFKEWAKDNFNKDNIISYWKLL